MSDAERYREAYLNLKSRYDDLERENTRLRRELDSAEFRIRQELEPRIKSDERRYDNYATSPERGM